MNSQNQLSVPAGLQINTLDFVCASVTPVEQAFLEIAWIHTKIN